MLRLFSSPRINFSIVFAVVLPFCAPGIAQTDSASLALSLRDPQGASLAGCMELVNAGKDVHLTKCAAAGNLLTARALPAGDYTLIARSEGFASQSSTVVLRAGERHTMVMNLSLASVSSEVQVRASAMLLDPEGSQSQRLSAGTISRLPTASPGRTLIDAVQTQPGWLLEANGVLHPRGAEFDTMFVIDGLPITTNQSPGFAPQAGLNQVDAIEITTGGYPAEYGRRLGGVVSVTTARPRINGLHGQVQLEQGSFSTTTGAGSLGYGGENTAVSAAFNGFTTDRYLDPPTETNFTNHGLGRSFSTRLDHDFGTTQSLRLWFTNSDARFQVPNETTQQLAGQRQRRDVGAWAGYASYDRSLSANTLFSARFMARDATAVLTSNAQSVPIRPEQDRGLREEYLSLNVSSQRGRHELKTGVQLSRDHVREQFAYAVTDPKEFDPGVPPQFDFRGARTGHTEGAYIQDRYRRGPWTISAGLRWDRYKFLAQDSAWSPRVAIAYYSSPLKLVVHASYDRAFEEPPVENLLLASSSSVLRLGTGAAQIPVPLARGDFGEVGVSKLFASRVRVDTNVFLRNIRNVVDDDLLLNTGISIPNTFARASIYGAEVKLEIPGWGRFSGFASYSYLLGRAITPVTGGFFLGADAQQLLQPGIVFPISQDQRNTASGFLRYSVSKAIWVASSFLYGSGLPTEIDPGTTRADLIAQSSERIVNQIDIARGRVKPNYSLDLSAGWRIWQKEHRSAEVKLDVTNVTEKLNVINFEGLFSGTALGRPRSATVRVGYSF